jgi:protocatechuate 3,4-dioxygenase beta subunit
VIAEDAAPLAGVRILHNFKPLTWTDASGRFDVSVERESGPLQMEKAGFVAETVDRTGTDLVVRMKRAGVLTVRIVNERGEPVPMRAFRVAGPAGGIIARADERGEQRLTGLTPGRYSADLEDLPAPEAANEAQRNEQLSKRSDARTRANAARRSGTELRAGEEALITLIVTSPPVRTARNGGTIEGRISGPDDEPVDNATVWLIGPLTERSTRTDDTGRYEFQGVAAGTYRVHAIAPGFVPREFGQERRDAAQQGVVVKSREHVDRVDVRLLRGGSVTGRVFDERGQAYERVAVSVVEHLREEEGEREDLHTVGVDVTDEHGTFRVGGLEPGTYYVIARAGRRSEPPVYQPGVLVMSEATQVTVRDGVEQTDLDVTIPLSRGAIVSGTVFDPRGKPMRSGTMTLERAGWVNEPLLVRHVPIAADGSFVFLGVPAGGYSLWLGPQLALALRIQFGDTVAIAPPSSLFVPTGGKSLVIDGPGPITVDIRTSLAASVTGKLLTEGEGALDSPRAFELVADTGRARAVVHDDGTFEMRDLRGRMRFTLGAAPRGWFLKSLLIGGVNAADTPISFQDARETRNGVVALLARTGEVTGRVVDAGGQPAVQASVLVFPIDRKYWYDRSRYVVPARVEADGTFRVDAPPGEYWIAAATGRLDTSEKALERQAASAARLTVVAGESVTRDVRLSR